MQQLGVCVSTHDVTVYLLPNFRPLLIVRLLKVWYTWMLTFILYAVYFVEGVFIVVLFKIHYVSMVFVGYVYNYFQIVKMKKIIFFISWKLKIINHR